MATRIPIEDLKAREFWSPRQTARILGRGPDFWVSAFDAGDVDGYTQPSAHGTARYINADSARAYLERLSIARRARIVRQRSVSPMAGFRERLERDPEFQALQKSGQRA